MGLIAYREGMSSVERVGPVFEEIALALIR
jgi:hypothetical protein